MEAAAARRMAALDAAFQVIFDDWCEGRGYSGKSTNELVDEAVTVVDGADPEPASVVEHRLAVMGEAAELYLLGTDTDREVLEAEVGRSAPLVWATREYLAIPPANQDELVRRFAAAAMVAGTEDTRDLLVRLVAILGEADERGIPTDAEANRVESFAGAAGAELFRRLRERDPDEW